MRKKQNPFVIFLENFCLFMIVLVLIQTFMEDFSVYMEFPTFYIEKILLSAVIFDLFFTIEFIIRMIAGISKKRGVNYFFYRNGWIDLIASVPLLLLISGPEALKYFNQFLPNINIDIFTFQFINMNIFGMLKIIKAIRVARILRLLRVLKIFGKIKNVNSSMAQRHITVISTIVINTIILFIFTLSTLQSFNILPSEQSKLENEEKSIQNTLKNLTFIGNDKLIKKTLQNMGKNNEKIYTILYKNKYLYRKSIKNEEFFNLLNERNIEEFLECYDAESDDLKITFHRVEYFKTMALNNLINFSLIIIVLLLIIIFYSGHFAVTISDPVYVMRMGFEKRDYTLAVKIRKHYRDDDMFILANDYNMRWLPAKLRKLDEIKETSSKLKINDVFDEKK